jgi:soluble lytic murein transglycosylase-like protein
MPEKDELIALARKIAAAHHLDAEVVCGMCERESTWDPWSIRYEDGFYTKYIEKMIASHQLTNPTEERARAFSWGLMQVMGEVAREMGYTGPLAELCDPATGIEVGCRTLAHKIATNEGSIANSLQAYNGGSNPRYAAEVLALAEKYREA